MDFCIISPAAGLERYATLSKTHLVLAHVKNEQYWEFYRQRRDQGDTIILDNGEYEGGKSIEDFRELVHEFKPTVAVLPDFLFHPWQKTYNASKEFIEDTFLDGTNLSWMYVPQTIIGDLMGWIEGLYEGADNLNIQYIGLPRALATYYAPQLDAVRPKTCEFIKRHWSHLKVHALGMVKGDVNELNQLRDAGCDSIDSSAPVWRGWNDFQIGHRLIQWDKEGTECDFNALWRGHPENSRNELILKNLSACGVNIHANTSAAR